MKKILTLSTLALLVATAIAQDEPAVHPSAASRKYAAYRAQATDPIYSLAKVKALIKKIKVNKDDNMYLPDKAFNALTVQEKFSYCMLHGEDFSQNCNEMPQIENEQKKIFPYYPGPFGDEAVWSDRQRAFLDNNRKKAIGMLRETIAIRHRVGNNLKQAIFYLKATDLIPDVIAVYNRDRKDHDILTLLMQMMDDAKYQPFASTSLHKKFYGDDSNYMMSVPFEASTEKQILSLGTSFYKSRTK